MSRPQNPTGITFLDVNNIFFTILGYPMSYLEFFGVLFNLWSVWLVTRNNVLTWPVGIVAVVLFGVLFLQIRLYSDFVEQIYYLITGFYGWWQWLHPPDAAHEDARHELRITASTRASLVRHAAFIAVGTAIMWHVTANLHLWLPGLFTAPADYPFLDALTTTASFAAQILMARRKVECWPLWIAVDVIGVGLYAAKGVVFVAILYAVFLALAIKGWLEWRRLLRCE